MKSWLRLVRAPNAPTAVADVVAGAAIALVPLDAPRLWAVAAGSAALYAGGVALNDAFDVEKDRRLHPDRVLPSGAIGVGAARAVGVMLLLVGVLSGAASGGAGIVVAAALAGAIVAYDLLPDSAGLAGGLLLGGCRALNLYRGLEAAGTPPDDFWIYVGLHFSLVACITFISLGEDRAGSPTLVRAALSVLPFCYAAPAIAAFRGGHEGLSVLVLILSAELALWVVRPARREGGSPDGVVPRGVFSLSLVGGLTCLGLAQWVAAAALFLFFPLSRLLARAIAQRGS